MSNNILKIKYYKNGQFKGSEGASIFESSNLQSTLQFKFDEDLGDASVVANILIPYPEGSQLYGQSQKQSLFMKKQVDAEGGYIYSSAILRGYLAANGKAYVNAQVYASDGYIDATNSGRGIVVNGIAYYIEYTTETIGGVAKDLLVLEDANTGRTFVQQQEGIIVLENDLICLIKQFIASRDSDNIFNGTLRLTSGVEVKNYQQIEFKITASAPYYAPYPLTIEESYVLRQALASAQSDIAAAQADILLKQDKVDPDINEDGVDHSVVGNINDLLDRADNDEGDIGTLQGQMATAQQDIADLQRIVGYGINIVGTMTTQDALPSDQAVSDYVIDQTGEAPTRGLAVIVKVDYTSGTDTIYFYVFDGTNWHHFEMQFLNDAENGVKGLIQGNYNASDTTPGKLMVSIVSGEVAEIYYNANGIRHSLTSILADVVAKVINGTSAVEMAKEDGIGRNIAATYQTKQEGATKKYVQDYASPKALYDIGYANYINRTYETNVASGYNYNASNSVSSVGYSELTYIDKILDSDILLGNQNGVTNKIWLALNNTESVKIRITTEMYVDGQLVYTQATESASRLLAAGHAELFTIETIFDTINDPILLPRGSTIRQSIELWREEGTTITWLLLSTSTYSAYMTLNKIGFVRYSLEAEPDAIVSGHDSAPTIDSNGDLVVASTDGEINYANGESAPLTTILKLPIINSKSGVVGGAIKPVTAGAVAGALADKVDYIDITGWTSPLTSAQLDLLDQAKVPILTNSAGEVFFPKDLGHPAEYRFISQHTGGSVNRYILMEISKLDGTITYHDICVADDSAIAPVFSILRTYAVGDLVTFGGDLYICTTAVTVAGDFDPDNWTSTNVNDVCKPFFITSEYNKTLNLFNYDKRIVGYALIWDTGEIYANANYWTSDFIEIEENKQYAITGNNYSGVSFYNSNKVFISGLSGITSGSTFTSPANAVYMRIASQVSVTEVMLNEGSTALSYQPYNGAIVHEKQLAEQKVSAKKVNFKQLVLDKYVHNFVIAYREDINATGNNAFIDGHKYYVYYNIDTSASTDTFYVEIKDSGDNLTNRLYGGSTDVSEGKIITATSSYYKMTLWSNVQSPDTVIFKSLMCIDLTALFGAGQEPTLAQCQALFNADYYNYTSGKDMQLIYDGEKPIALVEIPQQEPTLLWSNPSPNSAQSSVSITVPSITNYKYLIFGIKINSQGDSSVEYVKQLCATGKAYYLSMYHNGNGFNRRLDTTSATQIDLGEGKLNSSTSDTSLILVEIYGTNTL